jgi:hypothetical protein
MGRRDQRMKASDTFREANFLFSKKVSFDEAFPEIEDIVIEVVEDGHGVRHWGPGDPKRTYRKPHLPGEYVDCSNSLCYNGGVSVGSIIRDMVRERVTERETSEVCRGYEGSPKGRRKYRSCMNFFKVKISIRYREQAEDPASS